jgi:hypothetical protein
MELLRNRIKQLDQEIERKLQSHEVGRLLTTIDGIGARTAACLIAELGDPSRFRDAGALASYVGIVPRLRQSGKRAFTGARGLPLGNARPAPSTVDADIGRRPKKPLVARALRSPVGCRQAAEGRTSGP